LPKTIRGGNRPYPALITINGRGKDRSPKGLADDFSDLWFNDLVQAQAIRSSFLLESNVGFDRCSPHSLSLGDNGLRLFLSSLNGNLSKDNRYTIFGVAELGLFGSRPLGILSGLHRSLGSTILTGVLFPGIFWSRILVGIPQNGFGSVWSGSGSGFSGVLLRQSDLTSRDVYSIESDSLRLEGVDLRLAKGPDLRFHKVNLRVDIVVLKSGERRKWILRITSGSDFELKHGLVNALEEVGRNDLGTVVLGEANALGLVPIVNPFLHIPPAKVA
jgi:hypothetical protein